MSLLGRFLPVGRRINVDAICNQYASIPEEAVLYKLLGDHLKAARKSFVDQSCTEHKLYKLARNLIEMSEDPNKEDLIDLVDFLISKTEPKDSE